MNETPGGYRNNTTDTLQLIQHSIADEKPLRALVEFTHLDRRLSMGEDIPRQWRGTRRNILQGTNEFMRLGEQLPAPPNTLFPVAFWDEERRELRRDLLVKEMDEYLNGEDMDDIVETVDGLLDVIVVAWGTLLEYVGTQRAEAAAKEVMDTNLSKVDGSLGPTQFNEMGKILKPEGWQPPDIAQALGLNDWMAHRQRLEEAREHRNDAAEDDDEADG